MIIYLHVTTLEYSYLTCAYAVRLRLLYLSPDHTFLDVQKHLKLDVFLSEVSIIYSAPYVPASLSWGLS